MPPQIKGIPISPLTGVLDARSNPSQMPNGAVRMRLNLSAVGNGKLRRGNGWSKLLSSANYNNQDFHDQLLTFTPGVGRQPVTMVFEAESTRGVRSLFVATQSKIAQLNEYSGNYRILGSGFGGEASNQASAYRFQCAQVGDYLAFTNDFEEPMYHVLEQNAIDAPTPLQKFTDFKVIGLSRAKVVWAWKNCLFFADVEMDGERFSYRLLWSGFNNPTGFDPAAPDSITGSKDLNSNERILAGRPLGNSFLIYTTRGIWEMTVVGGEQSFAFRRAYSGEENDGVAVLKYPNTLACLEDSHAYMAEDGIYFFNPYYGKPERAEWLHLSTPLIYDGINTRNCEAHVSHYSRNELYFSVAKLGDAYDCPSITLRVNMSYKVADIIDYGFTAFSNYRSYRVPTIRDFIIENGICTLEEMQAAGYGFENEGLPRPLPASTASFTPQSIYTSTPKVVGSGDDLGVGKAITQVARTSNVATLTVTAHGFSSGNHVQIRGISDASFNSPSATITVLDANHFTYPSKGANVSTTAAASPQVRVIGSPREAVAIVLADGTVTVKMPAHGLSNGQLINSFGKLGGNPLLNGRHVVITVLDANTFTYPTSAVVAATQYGMANIANVIPDRALYTWNPDGTPHYTDDSGMVVGQIYYFVAAENDVKLHLTGPNTDVTSGNHFVYDGNGIDLFGIDDPDFTHPYLFSSTTSTPPAAGQLRFNDANPAIGTHLYVARIDNGSDDQSQDLRSIQPNDTLRVVKQSDHTIFHTLKVTHVAKHNAYYDVSYTYVTGSGTLTNLDVVDFSSIPTDEDNLLVTAKIFTGLKMQVSTVGAAQVPSQFSRNDPDNLDVVTATLTAHGFLPNTQIEVSGVSDSSFNSMGAKVIVIENAEHPEFSVTDANHFTYRRVGNITDPVPAVNAFAALLTETNVAPEDYMLSESDADSLCALLGDLRLDSECRTCEGPTLLVAASSIDWCLKQIDPDVMYRERCANPTAVGITDANGYTSAVGSYILDGYDSLLRFAPMFSGKPELKASELRLDYIAQPQATPSLIGLRVGVSAQVMDPNEEGCMVWFQHSLKALKCLSNRVEVEHIQNNTVPSEYQAWVFYRKGRVLYFELKMSGTGGDAFFMDIVSDVEQVATNNF